jgi:hypothetical protein
MRKLLLSAFLVAAAICCQCQVARTICISGGEFDKPFIRKVIELTGKTDPKICFLPTAAADNPYEIAWWYELCQGMPMKPFVMRVFLNSSPEQKSFEETLMDMDAIVVGGGSTLNMMGIWKAQGIDTVLRQAYQKGIVMAGGSAGSLCWFNAGLSDSRPKQLSVVGCLASLAPVIVHIITAILFANPCIRKLLLRANLLRVMLVMIVPGSYLKTKNMSCHLLPIRQAILITYLLLVER